jgi:hypothetical protein
MHTQCRSRGHALKRVLCARSQGKGRWFNVEPAWQACAVLRQRSVESKECRVALSLVSDYDVTPDLADALQKGEVSLGNALPFHARWAY